MDPQNPPILEYPGRGEAIIEPVQLFRRHKRIPERVVLCFFREVIDALLAQKKLKLLHRLTGEGEAITVGAKVYWDVADGVAKEDAEAGANKLIGKTVAAAGDDDATVRVRLNQ